MSAIFEKKQLTVLLQDFHRLTGLRAAAFDAHGAEFLSYPPELLRWQETLSRSSGAGLYRIETGEAVCCAAAERDGETLLVRELLPDCSEAAAALADRLGCREAAFRTAGGTSLPRPGV